MNEKCFACLGEGCAGGCPNCSKDHPGVDRVADLEAEANRVSRGVWKETATQRGKQLCDQSETIEKQRKQTLADQVTIAALEGELAIKDALSRQAEGWRVTDRKILDARNAEIALLRLAAQKEDGA